MTEEDIERLSMIYILSSTSGFIFDRFKKDEAVIKLSKLSSKELINEIINTDTQTNFKFAVKVYAYMIAFLIRYPEQHDVLKNAVQNKYLFWANSLINLSKKNYENNLKEKEVMSYKSDLESAHAHIDVLQKELRDIKGETAEDDKLKTDKDSNTKSNKYLYMKTVFIFFAFSILIGSISLLIKTCNTALDKKVSINKKIGRLCLNGMGNEVIYVSSSTDLCRQKPYTCRRDGFILCRLYDTNKQIEINKIINISKELYKQKI